MLPTTAEKTEEKRHVIQVANWMHRIMVENGPNKLARRPGAGTCRSFLEVAPYPQLLALLREMHRAKEKPTARYTWFIEEARIRIPGAARRQDPKSWPGEARA